MIVGRETSAVVSREEAYESDSAGVKRLWTGEDPGWRESVIQRLSRDSESGAAVAGPGL